LAARIGRAGASVKTPAPMSVPKNVLLRMTQPLYCKARETLARAIIIFPKMDTARCVDENWGAHVTKDGANPGEAHTKKLPGRHRRGQEKNHREYGQASNSANQRATTTFQPTDGPPAQRASRSSRAASAAPVGLRRS